ncbi:MAG: Cna B-type domain-containing protein [Lachnospiraceae bacterium]|nr:Cna B-type domain-containing protein [Clostridiales bacterium]MCC8141522.1 Cna B-type domain-containing protein [Lachnospiraceae bacterium]
MKRNRRSRKKNRFYSALVAMLMVVAMAGTTVSTGMAAEISGDSDAGAPTAYAAVEDTASVADSYASYAGLEEGAQGDLGRSDAYESAGDAVEEMPEEAVSVIDEDAEDVVSEMQSAGSDADMESGAEADEESVSLTGMGDESVSVAIVWDDENDKDERRPESVEIRLMVDTGARDADGAPVLLSARDAGDQEYTAVVTEENADGDDSVWKYTFTDLPATTAQTDLSESSDPDGEESVEEGESISYAIEAEDVVNYDAETTGDAAEGYIVTYASVEDYLPDGDGIYGQVVLNPSNKLLNVGATNGASRQTVGSLRSYVNEDGMLTIYLPGQLDESQYGGKNYSLLTGEGGASSGDGVFSLGKFSNNYPPHIAGMVQHSYRGIL